MASYAVDRARWARMGICEQLGNVAAEVGRTIAAHRTGKTKRADAAFDRALDLFDATAETLAAQGELHRLREVLRSREEFVALFYDDRFDRDAEVVERYFMQFSYAARNDMAT